MRLRKLLLVALVLMLVGKVAAQSDDKAVVLLPIFSGRPDPTWTLSANQTQALQQILKTLPEGEAAAMPDNLGYRGFEVRFESGSLRRTMIWGGYIQLETEAGTRWVRDDGRTVEIWLLGTAGNALEADLTATLWAEMMTPLGTKTGEGLAIYLLADDQLMPVEVAHADLAALRLPPQPILSQEDITVYRAETHEFEVTAAALERLKALQVPVSGIPFVVCVDGEPIYPGAFWTSLSSLSFDAAVVIDVLRGEAMGMLQIDLGYPSPEFFASEDRRSDPRILDALAAAGKLE
ncbi:MAG TPA: hypothetical protein VHO69_05525 [Phototrophicaceae bacterium]|nr:hypothetical protein [Phototrophicaceae bacterium]